MDRTDHTRLPPPRDRSAAVAGALLLAAALASVPGCESAPNDAAAPRANSGALAPADFARPSDGPPTSLTTRASSGADSGDAVLQLDGADQHPAPASPLVSAPPTDRVLEISAAPSAPPLDIRVGQVPASAPNARASSTSVVLDARVGQVNGRPVFASEVLEPLDGRLRRLGAESRTQDIWTRQASRLIYDELIRRVRDELVLAEARANLTTDQRRGLLFFLNDIQQNLVRSNRGSAVAADEALRQSTSRTLAQEAQDRLDRELIANEFRTRVLPRVAVPWRDVKQEYEANFEKYNPPPVARLRLITVDASNSAAVTQVTSALSAGTPFADVAALPANAFKRKESGDYAQSVSGSLAETKLSEIAELDKAMRSLSPGQTLGPISYSANSRLAWVHLEAIEAQPGRTLYEAQYEIEQSLREDRFRREEMRYFDNLLKRGNMSKFEDMMTQLVQIAQERYMPAKLAAGPSAPPAPARP